MPPDVRHEIGKESIETRVPAMPPDVRRGFAPPERIACSMRLSLSFGLCPIRIGAQPEPWAQPIPRYQVNGGAEPRLTSGGGAGAEVSSSPWHLGKIGVRYER